MKKQRVLPQTKGQDKTLQKQLNEVEIGNLAEKERRQRLRRCKKCLPNTGRTKEQAEMKNTLEGINSRITEAEEEISDLEDRMVEVIAAEQNIERRME